MRHNTFEILSTIRPQMLVQLQFAHSSTILFTPWGCIESTWLLVHICRLSLIKDTNNDQQKAVTNTFSNAWNTLKNGVTAIADAMFPAPSRVSLALA